MFILYIYNKVPSNVSKSERINPVYGPFSYKQLSQQPHKRWWFFNAQIKVTLAEVRTTC